MFKQSDLIFKYNWRHDKDDNPLLINFPDSDLLDRNEGYEVLYFIRKIMDKYQLTQINSGKVIEILIHEYLPGSIRSQKNVEKFITDNWNSKRDSIIIKYNLS